MRGGVHVPLAFGTRFGRLETTSGPERVAGRRPIHYRCMCECGTERLYAINNLTSGRSTSCGCVSGRVLQTTERHGGFGTPEYDAWRGMIRRCSDEKRRDFHRYGGRGITVCPRWRSSFQAFLDDMGARPSSAHSLDRIDFNGNYEPRNCRWATQPEQQRNRCDTRFLTLRGETKCVTEWARKVGLKPVTLRARLSKGMDPERAVFTPAGQTKGGR